METKTIEAIFLDRDGIINEVVMRDGVVSSPRCAGEFRVLPDFVEFYNSIRKHKVKLFVISNQPDVKRNLLDSSELTLMDEAMKSQFQFDEIVYCTHDDSDCCECRKPKPGMIISLLQKHGLQRDRVIFIGDSKKDVGAGKAAGVTTVYLRRSYNSEAEGAEFTVHSLREVLDIVTFVEEQQ